jgi:nicotinamidase-related amidase
MELSQIRKALLIVDLQQDFISPNGPFKHTHAKVDHIISNLRDVLPQFREENGTVIWIKSDYSNSELEAKYLIRPEGKQFEDVPLNNTYLSGTHTTFPMCIPGKDGDKFIDDVYSILNNEQDQIICKRYYSAFTDTILVNILKDIHEVHICGLSTNCCVQATATDAFFHGYKVFVWIDCLGYRNKKRHNEALDYMERWYATLTTSRKSLWKSEIAN